MFKFTQLMIAIFISLFIANSNVSGQSSSVLKNSNRSTNAQLLQLTKDQLYTYISIYNDKEKLAAFLTKLKVVTGVDTTFSALPMGNYLRVYAINEYLYTELITKAPFELQIINNYNFFQCRLINRTNQQFIQNAVINSLNQKIQYDKVTQAYVLKNNMIAKFININLEGIDYVFQIGRKFGNNASNIPTFLRPINIFSSILDDVNTIYYTLNDIKREALGSLLYKNNYWKSYRWRRDLQDNSAPLIDHYKFLSDKIEYYNNKQLKEYDINAYYLSKPKYKSRALKNYAYDLRITFF